MLLIYVLLLFFMLFYAGAEIERPLLRVAYIISVIAIIAGQVLLLLLIMHWSLGFSFTKPLMIGGAWSCALIYAYNFIHNRSKKLQDYLLMAWLTCFAIDLPYYGYHLPYSSYLHTIDSILVWINLLYAIYLNFKGE